jgi:hypothetical protein
MSEVTLPDHWRGGGERGIVKYCAISKSAKRIMVQALGFVANRSHFIDVDLRLGHSPHRFQILKRNAQY